MRLLYFSDKRQLYTERDFRSKASYWNNLVPRLQDKINYMDLSAFHAFSAASVENLNEHLSGKNCVTDARNFRPNIVISGLPAFDEDRWLQIRINKTELICYKPCTRCVLTTVNPDTGEKNKDMQPLRELRNYRLAPDGKLRKEFKDSPIFGVNLAIVNPGRISVGEDVEIMYKPSPF